MTFLLVGLGGAFGALARYSLGRFISKKSGSIFPVATFIINLSGALMLGVLTRLGGSGSLYILFGDGFLGAFTTFSTFMYEGFHLFKKNEKLNAYAYVIGSLVLGVLGFFLGYVLVGLFSL